MEMKKRLVTVLLVQVRVKDSMKVTHVMPVRAVEYSDELG
jgi:hypothetical protein